ncbi:MAG TPA: nicotinate-nucleotide pyrophosphorylase [Thermoanaerobacterales bacterium]|nr:nicotinate-nucleotide pyrophosphorylase [Thermoanaerobacterales bacterium]
MELREFLFVPLEMEKFDFAITSKQNGIFSGSTNLRSLADELGLEVRWIAPEGYRLEKGSCVFRSSGTSNKIIRAEEMLLGVIGKPSGVATAAARFVTEARECIKIVCGAWKKVDPRVRSDLRQAIVTGGGGIRITECPFIYLDKNYIRMLGGVEAAVNRARAYDKKRVITVQLRGEKQTIEQEALVAVDAGASILMVDTGNLRDLEIVDRVLKSAVLREKVEVAFSGGITLSDMQLIINGGADIVDVGRAIIDGPMLDFTLDVI